MKARIWLLWWVAPLVGLAIGMLVGQRLTDGESGASFEAPSTMTPVEIATFEGAAAMTMANVTWVTGSLEQVKHASSAALQALPESAGRERARLFLRLSLIDDNPDGQRALSASACAADTSVCADQAAAARREAQLRLVTPGNRLPLWMLGGHPPIP